ncbi:hypothetical protein D1872_330480 [compost metagenome]
MRDPACKFGFGQIHGNERHGDIFRDTQMIEKVERLEDKSNRRSPELGCMQIGQFRDMLTLDDDIAGGRFEQRGDDRQQG